MSRSNQLAGLLTADPPSALDTINEINTALGNDAALSTTLTNSIATKASKSGDTFTGNVIVNKAGTATEPTMRVTSALESSSGIHSHGFSATFLNTSNNANAHGVAIGSKHADSNSLIIGQHDTTFDHFIVKGNGNVGVGVDPSNKLHVYDSADHARLSIQCANSSGRHWQFQSRNDGVFWIRDDTAGANRMIFNTSGQVGIGCTPSHHLHIEPAGYTGSYCTLRLKHPDSSAMKFATLDVRADDNNGLQIGVGSSGTSTSNFYRQSYIESYNRDLNLSTYTGGYNITLRTAPSGGSATERMRINSSGQVGIGCTPTGGLHVYDDRDITNNPNDKGIRLDESAGQWLLSLGESGVSNTSLCIRDVANSKYPIKINPQTHANSTPSVDIYTDGRVRFEKPIYAQSIRTLFLGMNTPLTINPSTQLGQSGTGGVFYVSFSSWPANAALFQVRWRNAGGNGGIIFSSYNDIVNASGLGLSVSHAQNNNIGDTTITITTTGHHSNVHGYSGGVVNFTHSSS